MSNDIFPNLRGLTYPVTKTPEFPGNLVVRAASGKEIAMNLAPNPLWHFDLQYSILRDGGPSDGLTDRDGLALAYSEFRTLVGFYAAHRASFDSFLFHDPDDYQVTGQVLGTGNGANTDFQLLRDMGGFLEYIQNPDAATLIVYKNGIVQASGYTVSTTGMVTFTSPPANGVVVTADFEFLYRLRFMDDTLDFSKFMDNLWEAKSIKLITRLV